MRKLQAKKKGKPSPCDSCTSRECDLDEYGSVVAEIYSLVNPYRDGMNGALKLDAISDVCDMYGLPDEEKLYVVSVLGHVNIAEQKHHRSKKDKPKEQDTSAPPKRVRKK